MSLEAELPEIPGHRVIRELGRGGMGVVYLAETRETPPRRVAIKLLKDGAAFDAKLLRRFVREGALGRALEHESILPVRAFGDVNGRPYLVMDCVEGRSVAQVLAGRTPDPSSIHRALRGIAQAARALDHAHRHGVVHRDVKPGNILVRDDGRAFLIDFGLARELDSETDLTSSGVTVGTPWYMSPEQLSGDRAKIGPASDVYALGVCVYEAATGRVPFRAATWEELRRKVSADEPPRFASWTRDVHGVPAELRGLEPIALKAIEKRPAHRYATAGALADDLERVIEGLPASSHAFELSFRRRWRGVLRQKWRLVVGVIAGLLLAGAAISWRLVLAGVEKHEMRIAGLYSSADLNLSRHEFQDALADLDSAIALDPQRPESYLRRATAYAEVDRTFDARSDVEQAIHLGFNVERAAQGTPLERYRYAIYLMSSHRYAEAAAVLRELTEHDLVADRDLRHRLYQVYFSRFRVEMLLGHTEIARKYLDTYREFVHDEGGVDPILASQMHVIDGKLDEAAHDLEGALANPPRDTATLARIHRRLGRLYQLRGQNADAEAQYNAALDLDPRQTLALLGLAKMHHDRMQALLQARWEGGASNVDLKASLNEEERATEDLANRCLSIEPQNVSAREVLAGVAHARGNPGEALSLLQKASAFAPGNAEVEALMYAYAVEWGVKLTGPKEKEYEQARLVFTQVLLYDPVQVEANFYMGTALGQPNELEESLVYLHDAQRGLELPHPGENEHSPASIARRRSMAIRIWLAIFSVACKLQSEGEAAQAYGQILPELERGAVYPSDLLSLAEALATSPLDCARDCAAARRILAEPVVLGLSPSLDRRAQMDAIESACR